MENLEDHGSYKKLKKYDDSLHVIIDSHVLASLKDEHKDTKYIEGPIKSYFRDLELRDEHLQDKTILDIGSADVLFDEYCKEKYHANVITLDVDEENLGQSHSRGVVGDARTLPFKNESFDLVISHASMPHILAPAFGDEDYTPLEGDLRETSLTDIGNVLKEAYRTLKPGGQIRMSTFSQKEEWVHVGNRVRADKTPHITKSTINQFERIKVIKDALDSLEKETDARCHFQSNEQGGLIIITKP